MTIQEEKISIWFIINPISGGKRKKTISHKILKYLDLLRFETSFFYTEHKGHALEITNNAIKENVQIVCPIHEIGTRLIHSSTALAIIPRGSGNGIANHLGISKKIKKAIDCINNNRMTLMDTVAVNDSFFIGTSGFGIDALIAEKFDSDKKRGFKTYLKHSFKEFIKYIETKVITEAKIELINSIAHYDGESVQVNKEVFLKVLPASLKVVVPVNKTLKI